MIFGSDTQRGGERLGGRFRCAGPPARAGGWSTCVPTATCIVLLALAGCLGDRSDRLIDGGDGPIIRDSAGVRIVENAAPTGAPWQISEAPVFTVGWDPGGPLFSWPQSATILPDGGAVLGEASESRLYRLGAGGAVLDTWGTRGEGPGEYQRFDAIFLHGDTILISDSRQARITYLTVDGRVLDTHHVTVGPLHQASSALPDGRLVFVPVDGYGPAPEVKSEWVFQTQPILAADLGRPGLDTLADLPHLKRWYGTRAASPGPLGVMGRAGGSPDGFAWARSDRAEVRWYDASGQLSQVARWGEAPVAVTPEYEAELARMGAEAMRERGVDESAIAAQLADLREGLDLREGPAPYWSRFHVDRSGAVWLGEYPRPGGMPRRYRVIDRDGAFRGWVEVPDMVTILDIADDRILMVRYDEFDVPAVEMRTLIRR